MLATDQFRPSTRPDLTSTMIETEPPPDYWGAVAG